jgi:methyl-accepting chemotaxis protein
MLWFRNQNLFKKLMLSFGFVGVLVAALGVFSVMQLSDLNSRLVDMNENWMPSIRDLMNLKADILENRTYQYAALLTIMGEKDSPARQEKIDGYFKKSTELQAKDVDVRKHYLTAITGSQERALWDDAAKKLDAYWDVNTALFKLVNTGDVPGATKLALEDARTVRQAATTSLQADLDFNSSNADKVVIDSKAAYLRNRLMLITGAVLLIAAGLGLGFFIARMLSKSLKRASEVADEIANGRLNNVIKVDSADESGQLLKSMSLMQDTIKDVVAAQAEMARKHHEGAISHRVDTARFPGTYGEMAHQVNEMVAEHIGVKMKVVEVVKAYAEGNFAIDMDRLPGEKAVISASMDSVKASFKAISAQIRTLVAAAGRGDFSARGDVTLYKYEFQEMVTGLNDLMNTCDTSLSEIARVLSALADGDLTQHVEGEFEGTFGALKDDANKTVDSLKSIVAEIRVATESINTAASEIAQGNMDLSSRTESQAASLEETAASMEELTSTVKATADNARQSSKQAGEAAQVATEGGQAVARVVDTMRDISESSKRISDIIGVIDGIAFQTNILALNAAVEAARAGEQGRGFAVVATEVRSLAQRSAAAAKEIKDLISNSVQKVEVGARQVDEAGQTMGTMVASVDRVRQFITDISSAAQEQSSGIDQVNTAVTQMDQVTQQNAALVEEAAAAAKSMEEQAQSLQAQVARFRLPSESGAAQAPAARTLTRPAGSTKLAIASASKARPSLVGRAATTARVLGSSGSSGPAKPAATVAKATKPAAKASLNIPAPVTESNDAEWEEF